MSRVNCLDCVRKHLAQASILMDESKLGYPHHKWYAVGHLAEAESECRNKYPEFAKYIRDNRLTIMLDDPTQNEPSFDKLILRATELAGEKIEFDPLNSKKFDEEESTVG